MQELLLLIKPASGLCNMKCDYCFYCDISNKRDIASYGIMTFDTLEVVVEKALAYADRACTFAFQGGEPTLAGFEFFEHLMELEKKHNVKNIKIYNTMQTNGYAINQKWAEFLGKNQFLVGLSIDGIKATHDKYRHSGDGNDTFLKIMDTAALFQKYEVEFNVLTVVNAKTAVKIRRIYEFYKKNGFNYQQYIACLDPVFEKKGEREYSLTPELYGNFLIELFDLWYLDLQWGRQPYIRQFENYVAIMMGQQPESCEQRGICGVQHVVEADGEVYPCDFYVLDSYKLGNLNAVTFEEIEQKRKEIKFVEKSDNHDEECRNCQYFALCRGGCERQRTDLPLGAGKRNYFCKGYQMFFEHSYDRLLDIARKLTR